MKKQLTLIFLKVNTNVNAMMINVSNDKYFLGKSILYNTCAFYRKVNVILTIVERIKVHSKLHVQVLFLLL